MRGAVAPWIHPAQRGFTLGRQLVQDVLIVDTVSRGVSMAARADLLPVFAALDLKSVFFFSMSAVVIPCFGPLWISCWFYSFCAGYLRGRGGVWRSSRISASAFLLLLASFRAAL